MPHEKRHKKRQKIVAKSEKMHCVKREKKFQLYDTQAKNENLPKKEKKKR